MSFYANIGFRFSIPASVEPDDSIILASAMPYHQLERRKINKYPHLKNRLFDPQLYLAGLDTATSNEHCLKLATYPWFGVGGLGNYDSGQQTQQQWKTDALQRISSIWPRTHMTDERNIRGVVRDCIDFQIRFGCNSIILPSPLTVDLNSDFRDELLWLDLSLEYISGLSDFNIPIFASIALSDLCVNHLEPDSNALLSVILDSVSSREIDGVYIVLEQASSQAETRQCSSSRALSSILHLTHIFKNDCNLDVAVNFLGQFGLACQAAGASLWGSNWYKSLYRLRLADKIAGGRAYPSYWNYPSISDIHLENDFDQINRSGNLQKIADETDASQNLILAARNGIRSENVPAWEYRSGNISASLEHYLLSAINSDSVQHSYTGHIQDFVQNWLQNALDNSKEIAGSLRNNYKTRFNHIEAWYDAFINYRELHNV